MNTGGILRLGELADAAKLAGVKEVFVDSREEWSRLRQAATAYTMRGSTSSRGCHSFMYEGVEYKWRWREQTPDDAYVECLEVAGMI